jgi:serine protease
MEKKVTWLIITFLMAAVLLTSCTTSVSGEITVTFGEKTSVTTTSPSQETTVTTTSPTGETTTTAPPTGETTTTSTTPTGETTTTAPPPEETTTTPTQSPKEKYGYACEEDLIEVMFAQDSMVRLHYGIPVDMATDALAGVDDILNKLEWFEWYRICDVPEETLDEIQAHGEANTGKPVYNLNNIYRLRIPMGLDIWAISEALEVLPGIMLARPVPKPMSLPQPNYVTNQGYLRSANSTPAGIDADYAWTQPGGNGSGVTVYDLEYYWNYDHPDIDNAVGPQSQINPNPISNPTTDANHGTAVIGVLVSENNSLGTTGICYGATMKTCGTYYTSYDSYEYSWDPAGAIAYALADARNNQWSPSVILLELEWDYSQQWDSNTSQWIPSYRYIPIEWYETLNGENQTFNPVYAAITNAVTNNISVVEAGGNGNVPTDALIWYQDANYKDSGAIIVGAGGAYSGGTYPEWPEGNLERLSFSSYGTRFNLQGWGENVVTTIGTDNITPGYRVLYDQEGANYRYTDTFAGTSSASAIIAGVVAVVQGNRLASGLLPLSPEAMRSLLADTGTPQRFGPPGNIGPLPNLARALTPFSIPTITVTSPNGGEVWNVGNNYTITWTSSGLSPNDRIDIQLSYIKDDGSRAEDVLFNNLPNTGNYTWIIPPNTIVNRQTDKYLMRVICISRSPIVQDYSNQTFSIVEAPRSITVTSPNGGEVWNVGNTYTITWTSSGLSPDDRIDIQLSYIKDDGSRAEDVLFNNLPNTGNYTWIIPPNTIVNRQKDKYLMRVICISRSPIVQDYSNQTFSIIS